jgi:hypothetical protein
VLKHLLYVLIPFVVQAQVVSTEQDSIGLGTQPIKTLPIQKHNGIGFNFGVIRFLCAPGRDVLRYKIDSLLSPYPDVFSSVSQVSDYSQLGISFPVIRLKYVYYPLPSFGLAPYVQYTFGMDALAYSTQELYGGIDVWYRTFPKGTAFKIGIGVCYGYSSISVSRKTGSITLSGYEVGADILTGFDTIFRKATFNLDVGFPIQYIQYNSQSWHLGTAVRNALIGFEVRPGFTTYF